MKAFFINRYGDNSVLQFGEIKKPEMGDYDVLVKVHSASVNPLDLKIQDGSLKVLFPYKFPIILGDDFSGVIEKIGKNVKNFKIGDKVYGRIEQVRTGSFTEFLSIKEYNSLVNLLLKATPQIVTETNVLFTFKNNFDIVLFIS